MRQQCTLHIRFFCSDENGATLATALVFLAILTLLGTVAVVTTITDTKIGANYKTGVQAFYDAEAGVQYTLASLPNGITSGTLFFKGITSTEIYTVTAPSGFSFDPVTTFTRVGTTRDYQFQVTGHAGSANSTIEVAFRRASVLPYGLFGDKRVDLFPDGAAYSYDSRTTSNPTPPNSTGAADVGSNGVFNANTNPHIDGDVSLGDDGAGTEGTLAYVGIPTVTGQAGKDVSRVSPDPLGASGGSVAAAITAASTTNDNIFAGISGNVINLGAGNTMTLTAGTYYLDSLTLAPGSTLNIDTSSGDVDIYLVGGLDAKFGSTISFTGNPPDFSLYSNATAPIIFQHFGVFKGMVYAPFARVEMKNMVLPSLAPVIFGLIWADTVDMIVDFTGGEFYIDTAVQDQFLANDVSLVSWKEIRN